MRAVRKHTDCPWVLLYLERWLKAPMQTADGSLIARDSETPQGGVVSPSWQISFSICVRHVDAAELREHPVRTVR